MKKTLIAIIFILASWSGPLFSQTQFGVTSGLASTVTGEGLLIGLYAGATAKVPIGGNWFISPAAILTVRGETFDARWWLDFDVPVTYRFDSGFFLELGVAVGLDFKYADSELMQFGGLGSIGYEFSDKLVIRSSTSYLAGEYVSYTTNKLGAVYFFGGKKGQTKRNSKSSGKRSL